MQASRVKSEEALRIGFIEAVVEQKEQLEGAVNDIVAEVMTTGPSAVMLSKELTLGFDRWTGSDEELRDWTLDFTSRMRGSSCEAACAKAGAIWRHGPHHEAQKSISRGMSLRFA